MKKLNHTTLIEELLIQHFNCKWYHIRKKRKLKAQILIELI